MTVRSHSRWTTKDRTSRSWYTCLPSARSPTRVCAALPTYWRYPFPSTGPCHRSRSSVAAFFQHLAATQIADPVGAGLLAPHAASLASSLLAYAAKLCGAEDLPILLQRERVLAYMRRQLGDPDLDVDSIAVGCHVSRRTLHRLFEGTGQTAMSHLRTLRVDAAQRLLANQADLSIESIAREVGFANDTHFYRSFRSVTGATPGEYRQLARQGAADLRTRAGRDE